MKSALFLVLVAVLVAPVSSPAQSSDSLEAIQQRLDALEQQNANLRSELQAVRSELDRLRQAAGPAPPSGLEALEERVELQATRLEEHDLVKAESSQKVPVRLTGMILFNAFANSRHANPARDYPYYAAPTAAATPNIGGTLRQSLFGLDFNTPDAIVGGQFRGSVLFDIFALSDIGSPDRPVGVNVNTSPRLRTAWVEGRWGSRSVLAGLASTVISPRAPNSLAQVSVPALSGAGSLYGWRQQIRFEQRAQLGAGNDLVGQVALAQTAEDWPRVQAEFASTLELKRPALEGHLSIGHAFDAARRVEIGSGLHVSNTHVAGMSIPSRIYSIDWFASPTARIDLAGAFFAGENIGNLANRNAYSFSLRMLSPGIVQGVAVRSRGGWAQAGFQATRRFKVTVYGGVEDPDDDDTVATDGVVRNAVGAVNTFFQLAPNVVTGFELSQTRTEWKAGQRPQLTHFDLYVAYLF